MKKIKFIKQQDNTDCGPACLAMIADYYGKRCSLAELRRITYNDKSGTTVLGLVIGAKKIGIEARAIKCNAENLQKNIKLPCILHVITDEMRAHYIVCYKTDTSFFYFVDPQRGYVKVRKTEFCEIGNKCGRYNWTRIVIAFENTDCKKTEKNKRKVYLRKICRNTPKKLILGLLFSLVCVLNEVLATYIYRNLLDFFLLGENIKNLLFILLVYAGVRMGGLIFEFLKNMMLAFFCKESDIRLLDSFYFHSLKLSAEEIETRQVGEIVARFQDVGKVRDLFLNLPLNVLVNVILIMAYLLFLIINERKLVLLFLVIIFLYGVTALTFKRKYRLSNCDYMTKNAELTAKLVESFNGFIDIKTFNAEEKMRALMHKKITNVYSSALKMVKFENIQVLMKQMIYYLGYVVVMLVCGMSVIRAEMSIGQAIFFGAFYNIFFEPVKNLLFLQPQVGKAKAALERTEEFFCFGEEKYIEDFNLNKGDLIIEFKNVDFRYGAKTLVLKNFSIEIHEGEKIAVVGENGSGKSTVAKLILALYKPEKGIIEYCGQNLDKLSIAKLRKEVIYVSQMSFLFNDTIKNNILFGITLTGETETNLKRVSETVGLKSVIDCLPNGIESFVEENGKNLSNGQKQKIILARALIGNPRLLILDEATCNMDEKTENDVIDNLIHEYENMAILFVTHNRETVRKCDKVIEMSDVK